MRIERRYESHQSKDHCEHYSRWNDTNELHECPGQCDTHWSKTVRNEPEGTIHPPLELIWNQGQPITKLHNIVNRVHRKKKATTAPSANGVNATTTSNHARTYSHHKLIM